MNPATKLFKSKPEMKPKIISTISLCILSVTSLFAQEKKDYYDNGNIKFKGDYVYTWKEEDAMEYDIAEEANYQNSRSNSYNRDFEYISAMRNLLPAKTFNGFCTFYYPNGTKHFEGNYQYGVKNGKFTYWNSEGKKTAELGFKNGMADGKWQYWDENGILKQEFNYKAVDPAQLAKLNTMLYSRTIDKNDDNFLSIRERKPFKNSLLISNAYSERTRQFEEFIKDNLFGPTIYDGNFIVYKKGHSFMEFQFKNNIPVGTWRIYDNNDKPVFECTFIDGIAQKVQEFEHPEWNKRMEEYQESQRKDSIRQASSPYRTTFISDDPNAVDPGAPQEKIFVAVEQMPGFPGGSTDMEKFIEKNLIYPKAALINKIEGRVYLRFVVSKTGTISSVIVTKGLGYGTDEEAIRIIKKMPVWKPGKQNGVPVSVYYNLPINFKIKQ